MGFQAKKPWELFTDRSLHWQLLTIILLNMAQQLNGINAVCMAHPRDILKISLYIFLSLKIKIISLCFQIYFYADYVFRQSGIPMDKIPYATVGTGACECITALTCVSIYFC